MRPMPLVSVIIPAYNASKYIDDAVNSILNQTYPNIEIIIVDDGSTDDTYQCLERHRCQNLKIIRTKNNGQSKACNIGFEHSKGELIKFFDADDVLNAQFIEEQIVLIGSATDVVISARWGRFFKDDISTFKLNHEEVQKEIKPIEYLKDCLIRKSNMLQCGLFLIPREILYKSGVWNETLSLNNDFDFFVRVLLNANKLIFSEKSILYYRSGLTSSLSNSKGETAFRSGVTSNLLGVESILNFQNTQIIREACAEHLKTWMFMTYPRHKALSEEVEIEIKRLSNKRPLYGEKRIVQIFSALLGWKIIRTLSYKYRGV